jgi:hypothetical protein
MNNVKVFRTGGDLLYLKMEIHSEDSIFTSRANVITKKNPQNLFHHELMMLYHFFW